MAGPYHLILRIRKGLYPHEGAWKGLLDRIIYPVGLMGPIMLLPQVFKVFVEQNAEGLSLLAWLLLLFPALLWSLYGFAHKERVIVIANVAWCVAYAAVIIGILLYGQ